MPWIDNGKGQWVWDSTDVQDPNAYYNTPKPSNAPPSGGGGNGNLPPAYSGATVEAQPGYVPRTAEEQAEWERGPVGAQIARRDNTTNLDKEKSANTVLDAFRDKMGGRADSTYDSYISRSDADRASRTSDYQSLVDRYDAIGHDNTESDESREQQQEALKMQREIFERALNFDPNAAAQDESDRTLKQMLIAGSSARGGAGAQQAGRNAALQQAPSVFGEAQRNARQEGLARNQQALAAATAFGGQATGNRAQDEQRSAYESDLGTRLTDSVAQITGTKWNLDSQSTQGLGQIAVEYARLQASGVQMSSQELIAWWDQQTKRYGIDKNFTSSMKQIEASQPSTLDQVLAGVTAATKVASVVKPV